MQDKDIRAMQDTVPDFAGALALRAADALEAALRSLPADKRTWRPLDKARSATDLVAECAVTNRCFADLIESAREAWRAGAFEPTPRLAAAVAAVPNDLPTWLRLKNEVDETPDAAAAALRASAVDLAAAIGSAPLDALGAALELPFGTMSLSQVIWHPVWNMTYHEGQVNYVSTLIEGTGITERGR